VRRRLRTATPDRPNRAVWRLANISIQRTSSLRTTALKFARFAASAALNLPVSAEDGRPRGVPHGRPPGAF
jgi:hypothetical protein